MGLILVDLVLQEQTTGTTEDEALTARSARLWTSSSLDCFAISVRGPLLKDYLDRVTQCGLKLGFNASYYNSLKVLAPIHILTLNLCF